MPDRTFPFAGRDEPTGDIFGTSSPRSLVIPEDEASQRGIDTPWETEYPPKPPGGRW